MSLAFWAILVTCTPMTAQSPTKRCRQCKRVKSVSVFCELSGVPNPRGHFCFDCHIAMAKEGDMANLEYERHKIPKLRILFGDWWQYYAPPGEFLFTLFRERDSCPYCGGWRGPLYVPKSAGVQAFAGRAHLDHMDPLARGGEDSLRNVVYVCAACNMKKRKRLFVDWLKELDTTHQAIARQIYVEKHGHSPEAFIPGRRKARSSGLLMELMLEEAVLKQLYPEPLVTGPPQWVEQRAIY